MTMLDKLERPDRAVALPAMLDIMSGAAGTASHLAARAVSSIEYDILRTGCRAGSPLGSLQDMQESLGLGRPALREAIAILESRGLLEARRGPGGGLFVAAPDPTDVVGAMLLYLAINTAPGDSIAEFRLLTWRMIIDAANGLPHRADAPGRWGFAVDLAERARRPTLMVIAQIAEMLAQACGGLPAPGLHDWREVLGASAHAARYPERFRQLTRDPAAALDLAEEGLFWSGQKCSTVLAAKLTREMAANPARTEAEWETAERLCCTEQAVRQARRILQDFGVVDCQRGRKGAQWRGTANPSLAVRLMTSCLIARAITTEDNIAVSSALVELAPWLAAGREESRSQAAAMLAQDGPGTGGVAGFFEEENALLALSGNPLLEITVRSLGMANAFCGDTPIGWQDRMDLGPFNRPILEAIACGDASSALAQARVKNAAIRATTPGWPQRP